MTISDQSSVTDAERRRTARQLMGAPVGSPFSPWERLFIGFNDNTVFEYGQFDVVAVETMLGRSGKARGTEQVLTLPIRSANYKLIALKEDAGEKAFVQKWLDDFLPNLIDQCTTAVSYKRAFFECTWTMVDDEDRPDQKTIIYDAIEWRPPSGCEAGFNPKTGRYKGFRQRIVPVGGIFPGANDKGDLAAVMPGYVVVEPQRAFIYVHGAYRNPIHGISDLEVSLWCYETQQKILFLWFQFLENQALPKTIVYGDDIDQAAERVQELAALKSSGLLGLTKPEPGSKAFEILESSGVGAHQFYQAITYLEAQMTASVLAGFTDLPQAAVQGTGSYALSADQSEFFLASRQAVADEIGNAIRDGIIKPLVVQNFGPDASIPKLEIGPLSSAYLERALTMLQDVVRSRYSNVPRDFVDQLVVHVATFLGIDPVKVAEAIKADFEAAQGNIAAAKAAGIPLDPASGLPVVPIPVDGSKVDPASLPGGAPVGGTAGPLKPSKAVGNQKETGLFRPIPTLPSGVAAMASAVDTAYGLVQDALDEQDE